MLKKIKNFFLSFVCLLGFASIQAQISQNYFVYSNKGLIEVKGEIDGKLLVKEKDPATSINKAILHVNKNGGGELKISTGLYEINSPIILKSNIRLTGSGLGTVLKMGTANKESFIIKGEVIEQITVADLTLQGIDEQKESSGILFDHVGMGVINGVYARDFDKAGIWIRNDCFMCEVNSCLTSGNNFAGVYLSQNNWSGRGGNAVPNLITNCKSYGEDGNAFELWRSTCNNLVGNIVYQCKGHGFYLHEQSCSNLISGCRVFSGFKNAVYCNWAPETAVTGNIFCWNKGHGIEFENVVWGTISGNNIIDNGEVVDYAKDGWITGSSYGIYMHSDTKSIQVTGNAIFNWPDGHPPMIDGIYEAADCMFNNITNNNVQHYTGKPANVNGKNSVENNNMGNPDFYTEPWLGRFRPEKTAPVQVLKPLTREVVDEYLKSIRK